MRNWKKRTWVLFFVIDFLVVIQFITVNRNNPEVTGEINAPEEVMAILRRSCYDCHSNETVWPWYSYVSPASWLISSDVHDGREELNFSEWKDYTEKRKRHKRKECGEEVEEGEMPLWFYLPLHPEANLSPEDIETIVSWSKGEL
ncbi:MAG: heme-binding domain-containing protein [Phycisphaerae bacterium]|nr:heme-binding domain-containing protein [Phycisphaerae bacterium]